MRIINPKLNIVFALYLAIIPLIMSLIGLLEVYFSLPYYIVVWGIIYFLCVFFSIVSYLLKGGKINWKVIKNPLIIIALSMLFWMILTSIINTTFNLNLVVYLSYFLMFV
ncbi:MAG: hypothetical protein J6Q15_01670, partial [Clostridia bacterium]|nr:hypothetical protein [Clostridia bacterium]